MNIKCYDNGGESADRYTVIYLNYPEYYPGSFMSVGCDDKPFHPQGIGMHCAAVPGDHLGKEIKFTDLPKDVQTLVKQDLINTTPN
jgi:hypothetical protein